MLTRSSLEYLRANLYAGFSLEELLNSPATRHHFEEANLAYGDVIPDSLLELYAIANGERIYEFPPSHDLAPPTSIVVNIFGGFEFLDLATATFEYSKVVRRFEKIVTRLDIPDVDDHESINFLNRLFPFARCDTGYLFVDPFSVKGENRISFYDHEYGSKVYCICNSLDAFIDKVVEQYRKGNFNVKLRSIEDINGLDVQEHLMGDGGRIVDNLIT